MFARLSPVELLVETEKSIGVGRLWEMHRDLTIKAREQQDEARARAPAAPACGPAST